MSQVQLYSEVHDIWQILDTDTHRVIRAQKNYYDGIPELEMPKAGGREDRPHASTLPTRDQAQPLPASRCVAGGSRSRFRWTRAAPARGGSRATRRSVRRSR